MAGRLDGRTAIVTGAARGIGQGIARMLSGEGAAVVLVDRDADVAHEAAEEMASTGRKVRAIGADVSVRKDMEAVASAAMDWTGRIDILCPNAAIFDAARIADMPEALWDRLVAVNLKGAFLSVQACLPAMTAARYGRIVVTTSITGPRTAIPGMAHYAATKAGLNGFIRAAALEFAPLGITINGVEPGHVMTEGTAGHYDAPSVRAVESFIPLGRFGQPKDIAGAVLFLAGDEAAYITGTTILVDGGVTIPEYPPGYPRPA
jgi:3-oxoacyl-[acyl-carrier protein] reductase